MRAVNGAPALARRVRPGATAPRRERASEACEMDPRTSSGPRSLAQSALDTPCQNARRSGHSGHTRCRDAVADDQRRIVAHGDAATLERALHTDLLMPSSFWSIRQVSRSRRRRQRATVKRHVRAAGHARARALPARSPHRRATDTAAARRGPRRSLDSRALDVARTAPGACAAARSAAIAAV